VEPAPSSVAATGAAYRAFLQRIAGAAQRLGGRNRSPDAEIIAMVSAMLADPWVQALRQPLS
jgi:colicin import membrane protein